MSAPEDIIVIEYDDKYARDTVAMWRASKEKSLGVNDLHSFAEHVAFLKTRLANENTVYLALHKPSHSVAGIMALDGMELNQLYIGTDYQRMGIGTRLLNIAKQLSAGRLQLYTFEVNTGAQAFYEKHGFTIIGRGHDNEENLPDIRYEWIDSELPET